jgi:hypothetical protein
MAVKAEFEVKAVDPERTSFWGNTTTTGIVSGVLMAILMVVSLQIAERVDTMLTGGVFIPFGIVVEKVFDILAVVTYGFAASLIVANLNPIIAVATATGPMAPLWFFTNTGTVLAARIVHYYMVKKDIRDQSYLDTFWICLGGMIVDATIMFPVQLLYFQMPLKTIAIMKVAELATGTILPAFIINRAGKALKRMQQRSGQ